MTYLEIETSVHRALQKREDLETPGNCRTAASELLRIATLADQSFPKCTINYLTSSQENKGSGVHYALLITERDGTHHIINTVPTALYPQYIGPLSRAPLTFQQMRITQQIK